jgi:branched-subunit amino acid aminotransferase/4-amino-4-deoxychorismate lyase
VFIENCALQKTPVIEQVCTIHDLQNADEILMSNAGSGVCKIELA